MPESVNEASLPSIRTYPFGTTVLYSNQKSNRSPTINISAASCRMESRKRTIYLSLCRLVRRSGEPRWKSEMKKIFLPSAICMGKYNSLGIYQENIYVFWAMDTYNQRFFNVCCAAGAGCECDKRGDFVF